MDVSMLYRLSCPFCGGKFKADVKSGLEYNILSCYCGRYPVVAGIPVLKKDKTNDEVIALIESGRQRDALLSLIPLQKLSMLPVLLQYLPKVRSWVHNKTLQKYRKQAAVLLGEQINQVTVCELFDFYFHNKEAYNYFAFRFGQPRYLVALSFINSLIHRPEKPILDISCGCGHITRSLVHQAKGQKVIGVDEFFFGLYIAKHRIAPEADYVCCSADKSLPFQDGTFSVAFCSDAFHYFVNKITTIRELKRLIHGEGIIILLWVHNGLVRVPHDGLPLPPEGYKSLVVDMPHRVVADSNVLIRYLRKQGPLLNSSDDMRFLAGEPLLSVVASHRQEIFKDYGLFDDWPHANGRLGLNPLYVEDGKNEFGNVCLSRKFPSAFYEEDHAESKEYLPEKVCVPSKVLLDLEHRKRTPEMDRLIEQCVLLDIPERYY